MSALSKQAQPLRVTHPTRPLEAVTINGGKDIVVRDTSNPLKVEGKQSGELKGHSGWIYAIAISHDGALIAAGGSDKKIWVWEAATKVLKATLEGHTDNVFGLAFSPDSKTLASASWDGIAVLWDVATGSKKATIQTGNTKWCSIAFSPDGALVATGGGDNSVLVCDAATGAVKQTLKGHTNDVTAVAFSGDGKLLASGGLDNTIILWDTASWTQKAVLKGHTNTVLALSFSPDNTTLASGSNDNTAILWDIASGQQKAVLKGHTNCVWSVAFAPNGNILATGGDNTIKLWDPTTGAELATLQGHTSWVYSVAFSPDGRSLVSGSGDGTVRIWDITDSTAIGTLTGHTNAITALRFCAAGKHLLSSAPGDDNRLWDLPTASLVATIKLSTPGALEVAALSTCCGSAGPASASPSAAAAPGSGSAAETPAAPCQKCAQLETRLAAESAARGTAEAKAATELAARTRVEAEVAALKQQLAALSTSAPSGTVDAFVRGKPHLLTPGIIPAGTPPDAIFVPVLPDTPLFRFGQALCRRLGSFLPEPKAVAGFTLAGVDAVFNPPSTIAGYEARQQALCRRRGTGGDMFNFSSRSFSAKQLQVLGAVRHSFLERPEGVPPRFPNAVYAFHGTRVGDVLKNICQSGITAVRATDAGFFGMGVYTTLNIEYAARYAAGEFDASSRTPRADGAFPVVMVAANVGVGYPITPDEDYGQRKDGKSNFFGAGLKRGFDAHVACVSARSGFQAVDREHTEYVELVIDQECQVLPVAVLWMKPV